ncbi:MAG: molybdopterin-guanine dinucleotide biosynthesis protein B [Gammaproteobacteria bacterium]|nr:molybdopterin-guanine dinucleotide biosynthesis protein B [Gammaproteobacteria bacterium]
MLPADVRVLGFAAFSGVGKTSLLKRLIPLLREASLRIGLIKLSHHRFEVDVPGKDSYELRQAGAEQVLLCSSQRWALMTELAQPAEPELAQMLTHLDRDALDLVLVEGFRHEAFAKIELHRPSLGHPLLYPQDPHIIALACDLPLPDCPLPQLDLNQPEQVRDFILDRMRR